MLIPLNLKNNPYNFSNNFLADQLERLYGQCFLKPWNKESFETFLTYPVYGVWGCFCEKKYLVSALIALEDDVSADIVTLFTHPSYQRKGFSHALLNAHRQCHPSKDVFLEVSPLNTHAIALYKKNNFHIIGKRPHYYGKDHHALIMKKEGKKAPPASLIKNISF
jgi:ribosomal-protein-alanine N-acetyltransferase